MTDARTIDSFAPGASGDVQVQAALDWVTQQRASSRLTPPLLVTSEFTTTKTWTLPDGCVFVQPYAAGSLPRSAESVAALWHHAGAGPLFTVDHNAFDVELVGLTLEATRGGTLFDNAGYVLWTSVFRDLGTSGFRHLFGTDAAKFLNTACTWDGRWNVNNARGTQFRIGGSDSFLRFSELLGDVGGNATFRSEFAAANAWLIDLDGQEKVVELSGLYLTCEDGASGVRSNNSRGRGPVRLTSSVIEGRNAGQPCTRDLLRVAEGTVYTQGLQLNYANKPVANDQGAPVVVEAGGTLVLGQASHTRASGVETTRPLVHVKAGGELRGEDATLVGAAVGSSDKVTVTYEAGAVVAVDDTFLLRRV